MKITNMSPVVKGNIERTIEICRNTVAKRASHHGMNHKNSKPMSIIPITNNMNPHEIGLATKTNAKKPVTESARWASVSLTPAMCRTGPPPAL